MKRIGRVDVEVQKELEQLQALMRQRIYELGQLDMQMHHTRMDLVRIEKASQQALAMIKQEFGIEGDFTIDKEGSVFLLEALSEVHPAHKSK